MATPVHTWSLVRLQICLLAIWALNFVVLVVTVLGLRLWSPAHDPDELFDAIRQFATTMVPVIAAFFAFWLDDIQEPQLSEPVSRLKVFAVLTPTVLAFAVIVAFFMISVFTAKFPGKTSQSFLGTVSNTCSLFALFSAFIMPPVAYSLKRKVELGKPTDKA